MPRFDPGVPQRGSPHEPPATPRGRARDRRRSNSLQTAARGPGWRGRRQPEAVRQRRPEHVTGSARRCNQSDIHALATVTTRRPEGRCVIRPPGCLSRSTSVPGVEREARPAWVWQGRRDWAMDGNASLHLRRSIPLPRRSRGGDESPTGLRSPSTRDGSAENLRSTPNLAPIGRRSARPWPVRRGPPPPSRGRVGAAFRRRANPEGRASTSSSTPATAYERKASRLTSPDSPCRATRRDRSHARCASRPTGERPATVAPLANAGKRHGPMEMGRRDRRWRTWRGPAVFKAFIHQHVRTLRRGLRPAASRCSHGVLRLSRGRTRRVTAPALPTRHHRSGGRQ